MDAKEKIKENIRQQFSLWNYRKHIDFYHQLCLGIGLTFVIANVALFYWTFLQAYFRESKEITISINSIGEAKWEFILLIISLPFIAYLIKVLLWEVKYGKFRDNKKDT